MSGLTEHLNLAGDLSRYARLCYERRLVGAAGGNLSVRVPRQNAFLVTASGVALRDTAPENIVMIDDQGFVLESPEGLKPSKEVSFHLAIYKERPEVGAIIHVHPCYATVYAALRAPVPLATVSATLKLHQGELVPEANPGSKELSHNIVQALRASPREATVLLLDRHGIVAYRSNLGEAFDDAELTEDTAKIAFMTAQLKEMKKT